MVAPERQNPMIKMEYIWANAAVLVAAALYVRVRLALIARKRASVREDAEVPARAA
jgi:hypothetical protein